MGKSKKSKWIIKTKKACLTTLLFMMASFFFLSNAYAQDVFIPYENENPINLGEIIENNLADSNDVIYELTYDEIDLEYTTLYRNNSDLPTGAIQVVQEGTDGRQKVVAIKKYKGEELYKEEILQNNMTRASVDKIVEIGVGEGRYSNRVSKNDTLFVTSNLLTVWSSPLEKTDKVCTLKRNQEVRVIDISEDGEWLYIYSVEGQGYIQSNSVTKIDPNNPNGYDDSLSKAELMKNLNIKMDLNETSNLTLEQFEKILGDDPNDTNDVFKNNAKYFYYAEQQYHINGVFLAAVGVHESAWGTSTIAKNKKNLFGYGAYDSDPYNGAYSFKDYSEGIDLLARVFKKYYINPKGTVIYDGNIATGSFYSGTDLQSINRKYASDKNWYAKVYKWMNYLYEKL